MPAWTVERIREVDRIALESFGIPGLVLMENAGRGAADWILASMFQSSIPQQSPPHQRVLILCGCGNNGGDGFVIARHLHAADVPVAVWIFGESDRMAPDAMTNYSILAKTRVPCRWISMATGDSNQVWMQAEMGSVDLIVDAMLGSGGTGSPRGAMATAIDVANSIANHRSVTRIAIDIPTGLNAATGEPHPCTFRADVTLTFVAPKIGFDSPNAKEAIGRVVVLPIGVPPEVIEMVDTKNAAPRRED